MACQPEGIFKSGGFLLTICNFVIVPLSFLWPLPMLHLSLILGTIPVLFGWACLIGKSSYVLAGEVGIFDNIYNISLASGP